MRNILYAQLFFILIIVFSFAGAWNNNLFFALYPITISSIIPVNLLSYDEKSNWSLYACTFPCSRKEIVSSKYILTVCTLTLSAIIVEIVQIINMIIRHNFHISGLLTIFVSGKAAFRRVACLSCRKHSLGDAGRLRF